MNQITCKICGFSGLSLTTHIKYKHQLTGEQYKSKYGGQLSIMSGEQRKKLSDINKEKCKNPDVIKRMSEVQKNGSSRLTTKYWMNKGYSEADAISKIKQIQSDISNKHYLKIGKDGARKNSHFCSEYWIAKGKSETEATALVSKIQAKLSARSSKFSGHIRSGESKNKISKSMKTKIDSIGRSNWALHFGEFAGRSKAEISLYNYIKDNIDASATANVPIDQYIVDVLIEKKIIEFYGDFWHANPIKYPSDIKLKKILGEGKIASDVWKHDQIRVDKLKSLGYDVLIIWENDWNLNQEKCIAEIENYLHT